MKGFFFSILFVPDQMLNFLKENGILCVLRHLPAKHQAAKSQSELS